MKIVVNLTVKDEIDLIAANIDYHLKIGIYAIVVTDYNSSDGTRSVLESYSDNDRVDVIYAPSEKDYEYWECFALERIKNKYAPDLIGYFDADEFLYSPSCSMLDAATFEQDMLLVPRYNSISCINDQQLNPKSMSDLNNQRIVLTPPVNAFQQKESSNPVPWLYTKVKPKVLCKAMKLAQYSTAGHSAFDHKGNILSSTVSKNLFFIHFPFTTYTRFLKKVTNIVLLDDWLFSHKGESFAYHWKLWARIFVESGPEGILKEYQRQQIAATNSELSKYTDLAINC